MLPVERTDKHEQAFTANARAEKAAAKVIPHPLQQWLQQLLLEYWYQIKK